MNRESGKTEIFDTILFDLDGTIIDSAPGVIKSFIHSLDYYGIKYDPNDFNRVIGPPLEDSFIDFFGFTEENVAEPVAKYREFYTEHGIFDCTVYDGVEKLIANLCSRGKKLLVASSKPTVFVKRILEHNGLAKYFAYMVGSELDGSIKEKADVVNAALNLAGCRTDADKEKVLMVGDRFYDVVGAHAMGIKVAAVGWGYGSEKELADAEFYAKTPEMLDKLIK